MSRTRSLNFNLSLRLPYFVQIPTQQEPEFLLEFCITNIHERFHRDSSVDSYPIGPSTYETCRISHRILDHPFQSFPYIRNFLHSLDDLDIPSVFELTPQIVAFLTDPANRQQSLCGFYALAELQIVHQEWDVTIPTTGVVVDESFIFEEVDRPSGGAGLSRVAIENLKKKRGFYAAGCGGENSSDCSICLQDFSEGVKVIKTLCSHVFHENCIFKWLENRNSCPLCRTEIEI